MPPCKALRKLFAPQGQSRHFSSEGVRWTRCSPRWDTADGAAAARSYPPMRAVRTSTPVNWASQLQRVGSPLLCSRATWQRRSALVIGCQSLSAASLWGPSFYLYFWPWNSPACLSLLTNGLNYLSLWRQPLRYFYYWPVNSTGGAAAATGSDWTAAVASRPIGLDSCGSMPIDSSPFQLALCEHLDAGQLRRYRCW